jgi:CheY-like chemotaxis protein
METILVVDDEHLTIDLLRELLQDAGYTVLYAYNGKEAFDIYCQHGNAIDLVFTDNMMPDDGYTLISNIRKINPNIKYILFCSLSPCTSENRCDKGQAWRPVLIRPFKLENLLALIRDVLDEKVECGFNALCSDYIN